MNRRQLLISALAALTAIACSEGSYADVSLFGNYWENVARAAQDNDAARVRQLVANDANPNQTDSESRTGMHYAAMNGNLTIIAILIKAKAKLDPKDKLGNTPLHLAADRDQVEAMQLLLDVGTPVDPENKNGMTPLMVAANRGNIEIVRALLAKGASVTKTDFTGRDAAGWASESHNPAVMQAIKRAQKRQAILGEPDRSLLRV
jgi:ankyrin repeat protein